MAKSNAKIQHTLPFQNNLLGIIYMSVHVIALAVLYALVKRLTKELDSNLVVFLYKFSILVFITPWCFAGGLKGMKTNRIWLHASRGFFSILGSLSMFYALKHLGISDVTAVQYLEHVIMLIIGIIYFKEKASLIKFFVIAVSFLGALMVVRPDLFEGNPLLHGDTAGFNRYYVFVFMALTFWAMNNTVIKILGKTEKTKVQLFYVMLFSSILAFPAAFMKWQDFGSLGPVEIKYPYAMLSVSDLHLKSEHLKFIILLAICYLVHAITHFKAFKHAELSVVIPFEYTRLVYAGFLGYIFFDEIPSQFKFIGYLMIITAGLTLLYCEKRKLSRLHQKEKKSLEEEFDQ